MSDIDDLIKQAAYELQIRTSHNDAKDEMEPRQVNVTRKDGTLGQVQIHAKATYKEVIDILKVHSESEAMAETAKADRVAELEQELKRLKGE